MTAYELATIGERIFGPRWQRVFSAALGVNYRTLQRWATGQNTIPESVANDARRLLEIATTAEHERAAKAAPDGTNRPAGRHKPGGN